MKLTGILKDKVDKAETMEAKKDIIADKACYIIDRPFEKTINTFETTIKGEEELHFAQYVDDEDEDKEYNTSSNQCFSVPLV